MKLWFEEAIDDEYFGITTKEEKDKLSEYGVDEAQDHDLHEGDDLQGWGDRIDRWAWAHVGSGQADVQFGTKLGRQAGMSIDGRLTEDWQKKAVSWRRVFVRGVPRCAVIPALRQVGLRNGNL